MNKLTVHLELDLFLRHQEYFARFTTESVDRIGKLVRSLNWAWGSLHSDEFQAKRDEFISTTVPSFYSCQCVHVLERDWVLWFIENSKGDSVTAVSGSKRWGSSSVSLNR
ncbi:hypothetical protein F2Q69_00030833 [Brassica cretica]|uniref:Uncharacterized protein n=1 Tax=Brassica cretica TaxID=69181 RepID=A0A8S9S2I6_BRACR|nr:hypothetical protein F2Q69_00030833 [Brassica cretica]